MVKYSCNDSVDNNHKTRQKENRSEKVQQTKTETVKGKGRKLPDPVSLVYQIDMRKSILLLIIVSCIGCVLAFTVFSKFKIICLIVSAIIATTALIMALRNRKENQK